MIGNIAAIVKKCFKGNAVGDYVINFIRIRGIDEKLYVWENYRLYRRDVVHPSPEMIQARKFFRQNKSRVNHIAGLLADEESRVCFRKAVAYRCTHDRRKAPVFTKGRYFPEGIIDLSEEEVFIDGGAFVGDTVRQLYKITKGKYKKIVAFEPDEYNFRMLSRLKYHDVTKIKKGLWSDNGKLHFTNGGGCGSRVTQDSACVIAVDKLDEVRDCQAATFIKLDVEGAELQALKGAERLIKRNHPKLAICLYHSNEDMLDIIEYIHNLEPDYQLYVRHHSAFAVETVMYAVYNK